MSRSTRAAGGQGCVTGVRLDTDRSRAVEVKAERGQKVRTRSSASPGGWTRRAAEGTRWTSVDGP